MQRAARIRLFVTDLDGVWTDGTVRIHEDGSESLRFSIQDGLGVRTLLDAGVEIAIVSGRRAAAVEHRAARLGVTEVRQGVGDKAAELDVLCRARGLAAEQVAAMGDDVPDLELFDGASLRIAPRNAVPELRQAADFVTQAPGGAGALREACELLLAGVRAAAAP